MKSKRIVLDFEKLENELKIHGMSKQDLSNEIGRSKQYITGIRGKEIPENVENLICKILDRTPGYFILHDRDSVGENSNVSVLLKNLIDMNSRISEQLNILSERVAIIEDIYEKSIKTSSALEGKMDVAMQHLNAIRGKTNANTVQLENAKRSLAKMESFSKQRFENSCKK